MMQTEKQQYSFITQEELTSFTPLKIAQQAQAKIDSLNATIETLKAENASNNINHDQLVHQIEQQLNTITQENEKLKKENDAMRKEIDLLRMFDIYLALKLS